MTESEQRQAVVAEATSWLGTPFMHGQCVKGAGCDCATFLASCYRTAGVFRAEIPELQPDWFLHTSKEQYLDELRRHAQAFDPKERDPQPGDIMIVKDTAIGAKVYSHGAIVLRWPIVIHCFPPAVMMSSVVTYPAFVARKLLLFNPWGTPDA